MVLLDWFVQSWPHQRHFFFRPTPLGFRQVVQHARLHVAYWLIHLINAVTSSYLHRRWAAKVELTRPHQRQESSMRQGGRSHAALAETGMVKRDQAHQARQCVDGRQLNHERNRGLRGGLRGTLRGGVVAIPGLGEPWRPKRTPAVSCTILYTRGLLVLSHAECA